MGHSLDRSVNCFCLLDRNIDRWPSFIKTYERPDGFLPCRPQAGQGISVFFEFRPDDDSSGAATTASVVYKQGVGGVWVALQTLFMTPYYWFMNLWFRRARLVTVAELFEDRFGGKFLSVSYAVVTLFTMVLSIGLGNLIACKTLQPMIVKPVSSYTAAEHKMVTDYNDFIRLGTLNKSGNLSHEESAKYECLKIFMAKGNCNHMYRI